MTTQRDNNAVWAFAKCASTNVGVARLLSGAEPVLAGAPVVVRHQATGVGLSANPKNSEYTDFGPELEACCHNYVGTGKVGCLSAERDGSMTSYTVGRSELSLNHWTVVLDAAPPAEAPGDVRQTQEPLSSDGLMALVREQAEATVPGGVDGIAAAFAKMGPGVATKMDREDMRWALADMGVSIPEAPFGTLVEPYATDGFVAVADFLNALVKA